MSQTNLSGDNAAIPVLSLANELTMVIFKLVCQDAQFVLQTHGSKFNAHNHLVSDSHDNDHTPKINKKDRSYSDGQEVVLSHVCQAWREISLACPELWANFNHYERYGPEHLGNRLKVYLERTGTTRCLNLWFCLSSADEFNLLMDRIMPYASRWRRLSLTFILGRRRNFDRLGPQWNGMRILPSKTQTDKTVSFDNLEMLDIYPPRPISDPSNVLGAMGMGRKLSALRTSQMLIDKVHLQHLSVLHIEYMEGETNHERLLAWSTFISILTDIPNLMSLSISRNVFHLPPDTYYQDSEPIILSNLRHFRCSNSLLFKFIWKAFSAPQLEFLVLCNVAINQDLFPVPMSNTLPGSAAKMFPSLRTLVLADCPLDEYEEPDCLLLLARATPNISELIFSHDIVYGDPEADSQTILQYLSTAQLTDKIKSVWSGLTKLTYLPIPSNYSMADRDVGYLGDLVQRLHDRAMFSSKGCKLRVPEYFMHEWKEGVPALWGKYDIEEICEALPDIWKGSNPHDWIPWPPKSKVEFHRTAETRPYAHWW